MRKALLAIALLLVCGGLLRAEGARSGILGGFTSSSSNVENVTLQSVSLYHAGIGWNLPLGRLFALQPMLLYQVKGATLDEMDLSMSSFKKLETKVGYVEIPVQLQVRIPIPVVHPYVFGEPFIGYAVNVNAKSAEQTVKSFASSDIRRLEYGLSLGVGVELGKFQLSAKYFWNFGTLCNEGGSVDPSSIAETVHNAFKDKRNFNGLSLTLGLFF